MTTPATVPFDITRMVREIRVCLRVQRASRAIGRMFDDAFRPFGLTNFQFSLLMMLNRPSPPTIGRLAEDLAMHRTTITANLKPLGRRRLLTVRRDDQLRGSNDELSVMIWWIRALRAASPSFPCVPVEFFMRPSPVCLKAHGAPVTD